MGIEFIRNTQKETPFQPFEYSPVPQQEYGQSARNDESTVYWLTFSASAASCLEYSGTVKTPTPSVHPFE